MNNEAWEQSRQQWGTGSTGIGQGLGGVQLLDYTYPPYIYRIASGSNPYVGIPQTFNGTTWTDADTSAFGTPQNPQLYELNGRTDVPVNTRVFASVNPCGPGYVFMYAAAPASGGNGNSGRWAYVQVTGTTITSVYTLGFSSVTRTGTGIYQFTFVGTVPNTTYPVVSGQNHFPQDESILEYIPLVGVRNDSRTTSGFEVRLLDPYLSNPVDWSFSVFVPAGLGTLTTGGGLINDTIFLELPGGGLGW